MIFKEINLNPKQSVQFSVHSSHACKGARGIVINVRDDREMDDAWDAPPHGPWGEARTQGRLA